MTYYHLSIACKPASLSLLILGQFHLMMQTLVGKTSYPEYKYKGKLAMFEPSSITLSSLFSKLMLMHSSYSEPDASLIPTSTTIVNSSLV